MYRDSLSYAANWLLIVVQLLALGILARSARRSKPQTDLYTLMFAFFMLFLLQGQAIYLFYRFTTEEIDFIHFFYQDMTLQSATEANLHLTVYTVLTSAVYLIVKSKSKRRPIELPAAERRMLPTVATYGVAILALFGGSFAIVYRYGGLAELLQKPGSLIGGVFSLIGLISVAMLPLMTKWRYLGWSGCSWLDTLLFCGSFAMIVLNSRMLALVELLALMMIVHYKRGGLTRTVYVAASALFILVFVVYGIYRDTRHQQAAGLYSTGGDLIDHVRGVIAKDGPMGWVYERNVEGLAGLAGVIARDRMNSRPNRDYGASTALFFLGLVPHDFRMGPSSPLKAAVQWQQEHRISVSIVASSLEMSYIHFGAAGIVAFGLFSGIGLNFAHKQLCRTRRYFLVTSLLLTHALVLVRGTPSYVLLELALTTIAYAIYHVTLSDCNALKTKKSYLRRTPRQAAPVGTPVTGVLA